MYIKEQDWSQFIAPPSASWAVKFICKSKQEISPQIGTSWLTDGSYNTSDLYKKLHAAGEKLPWCKKSGITIMFQIQLHMLVGNAHETSNKREASFHLCG